MLRIYEIPAGITQSGLCMVALTFHAIEREYPLG